MTATSTRLKEEVKELQKELAELADLQQEMNKAREDEKDEYAVLKEDLDEGINGVQKALKVLRDYYEASEEALLQKDDGKFDAFMQQPAPPAKHSKAGGAGGGIIDMLE